MREGEGGVFEWSGDVEPSVLACRRRAVVLGVLSRYKLLCARLWDAAGGV
jgi:hypothetical protein